MTNLSIKLKNLRKSKNITQKEVSLALNIATNQYQTYEYGKANPSYENLIKLCKYFDVSSDYLLGLTDNPNSHKK